MPNQSIQLELDPHMEERMMRLASAQHKSPGLIVREALEQYVTREERRGELHTIAEAAWSSYQATGLHVTDEEADAWLAKLEAGESASQPSCHV